VWAAALLFALANSDAPDPEMSDGRQSTEIAGGLTFSNRGEERKTKAAAISTADEDKDGGRNDVATDEVPDASTSPNSSDDMLASEMPVVYLIWTAVLLGLFLNLLLLALYAHPALCCSHTRKGELGRELSLESAQAAYWQAQMKNLIIGWNLVPFGVLLLAGCRLMFFIQGLESTDNLRTTAATLFERSDKRNVLKYDLVPSKPGISPGPVIIAHG